MERLPGFKPAKAMVFAGEQQHLKGHAVLLPHLSHSSTQRPDYGLLEGRHLLTGTHLGADRRPAVMHLVHLAQHCMPLPLIGPGGSLAMLLACQFVPSVWVHAACVDMIMGAHSYVVHQSCRPAC